jgi:hypothetical protein
MPLTWDGLPERSRRLIVEVARIEGKIFKTMTEAEAHGLELAKQWVDKRRAEL